jgi:glycosyltransferase involved in cell wall biosynthesis
MAFWHLYRVLRRERFTIVHTHTAKPDLYGQIAARLAGVPIVLSTLHGFYFHEHMSAHWRRFYINLAKIGARCSDVILSQNREDINTAITETICSAPRIKHLGNGIDLNEFNPAHFSGAEINDIKQELGIAVGVPVIGFVGRLAAKRKGFLDFLAAGREVLREVPDVCLLVVGEADLGKADAVGPAAAADFGIEASCRFIGHRPNKELPRIYKAMNVLVLPSLFEGVPRVVMEASAMEVPAVVTNVRGSREAIEDGRNGSLVPLGDVSALAKAILCLLKNPQTASRMGRAGRRLALERFDEQLVFEKVKAEYARLLQEKGISVP